MRHCFKAVLIEIMPFLADFKNINKKKKKFTFILKHAKIQKIIDES